MQIEIVHEQRLSSNSFLLYDESSNKIIIIDIGLKGKYTNFNLKKNLNKILRKMANNPTIEVILTHSHIDHISGEDNLNEIKNIVYCSGILAAKHINARDKVTLLNEFGEKIEYKIERILQNNEIITLGENRLKVIYAPGHTEDSLVIYDEKSKSLFAGDVVFANGGCGRVDLPTGNKQSLINTLEMLAKMDVKTLYSGHGPEVYSNVRENILNAKHLLEFY